MIRISTEEKLEQERKHERSFIAYLFTALIIIIILFLLNLSFGYIEHRPLIPTGNVDIFDINFNKNCDCDEECDICDCEDPNEGESKPTVPSNPGDNVTAYDKETIYSTDTHLNIFTNTAYYVLDGRIAPGSENTYQFVIRNNNSFNIIYDLNMKETNEFNVNMRYRLKLNGVYVAGNDNEWVTYKELSQFNIGLTGKTYDVYTLEWKWFESKNDTEVGTSIDAYYKLDLGISVIGE